MNSVSFRFFSGLHRVLRSLAIRLVPRKEIEPRAFSNSELRKHASLFSGSVINVSGWDDRDGEGAHYRDYFTGCTAYTVSNAPTEDKGIGSVTDPSIREIPLDLTTPLSQELNGAFDVVFNHTTLEHIFEVETAFANLCAMSKDAVILVVPVLQQIHVTGSFGDYWRPTTLAVAKLFRKNGFEPLVIRTNDQPFYPVYCFAVAVRDPRKYEGRVAPCLDFQMGAALFGSSLKDHPLDGFTR